MFYNGLSCRKPVFTAHLLVKPIGFLTFLTCHGGYLWLVPVGGPYGCLVRLAASPGCPMAGAPGCPVLGSNGSFGWFVWLGHLVGSSGWFIWLVHLVGAFGWFIWLVHLVGSFGWFIWLGSTGWFIWLGSTG